MTNSLVYAILPLEDKRVVVRCQPVLLPERVGKTRREPVKKISLLCVLVIGALVLTTGCAGRGAMMTLQHNTQYEEVRSRVSSSPHFTASDTVESVSADSAETRVLITTGEWGSRDWMKHQKTMRGYETKAPQVMKVGTVPAGFQPAGTYSIFGGATILPGRSGQNPDGTYWVGGGGVTPR